MQFSIRHDRRGYDTALSKTYVETSVGSPVLKLVTEVAQGRMEHGPPHPLDTLFGSHLPENTPFRDRGDHSESSKGLRYGRKEGEPDDHG